MNSGMTTSGSEVFWNDPISVGIFFGKIAFVLIGLLHIAPIMLWVERRGSGWMQNRLGPNRVGPFGLFQAVADAVKFIFKQDHTPGHVNKFYYFLAPAVCVIPAFMTCAAIPFAGPLSFAGYNIQFQLANLNVGVLYVFSVASLGVYGIIMGGWASNNKYALLGSLRSSAQMISYELSLGLSIIGAIMIHGTVELGPIAAAQSSFLNWGFIAQPLGAILFLISIFAETNRLPFDLAEGESEIVAGYHLEYGALKFALFFLAEYANMAVGSAVFITLYFGGYQLIPGMELLLNALPVQGEWKDLARTAFEIASFTLKVGFMMWLFVWVRWTLPRFRYDQLMDIGWKVMFPLSLFNVVITALVIYWRSGNVS